MSAAAPPPVLRLEALSVAYRVRGRDLPILDAVGFEIARGEAYGLVGESGSGKSTVALAVQRVLPPNGRVTGGRALVEGRDVAGLDRAALRAVRARDVAMVFQDPGRALNPSITVGRQVAEAYGVLGVAPREAEKRAEEMLARVRISAPARVMAAYPHQLSGGMQQRAVIAMALAKSPSLLVLDEPTTGLDATVEAEVLDLVDALRRELGVAILFISHNLGAIAGLCDRVGVLYAGRLVEEGPARALFAAPRHPYTAGLLRCLPRADMRRGSAPLDAIPGFPPAPGAIRRGCVFAPRCGLADDLCRALDPPLAAVGEGRASRCHYPDRVDALPRATPAPASGPAPAGPGAVPVLALENLSKTYGAGAVRVHALRDVSLTLRAGETLGLVGESGSGKSTLAHALLGLLAPDPGGRVLLDGAPLPAEVRRRSPAEIKAVQIVFQNPDSALNRAKTVRSLVGRSVKRLAGLAGAARAAQVRRLLEAVRLTERQLPARPRQLSGGMKQRVAIARAFAGSPRLVVCDEPTSALDVSVQSAILNLLADLQAENRASYLLISHDLGVVRYMADHIAVLYLGRLMELGPAARVLDGPHHPYTEALLSAAPSVTGERGGRIRLAGAVPSALNPPAGCSFHTRCPRRIGPICDAEEPPFVPDAEGHAVRCHLPREALGRAAAPALAEPA